MKFFYGSFEKAFARYFSSPTDPEIREKLNYPGVSGLDEISILLLRSGLDENEYHIVEDIDSAEFSRYRKGDRNIKKAIARRYTPGDGRTDEQIYNKVYDYFYENLVDYIDEPSEAELRQDLFGLIESDYRVPLEAKKSFGELAKNASLDEFLVRAFIYVVRVKSRRDIIKFMISNIPFEENVWFTGREAELKTLYNNFRQGENRQTISGAAGCGKTQLAVEFIYWQAKSYDYVCWIDAETEDSMLSSMGKFLEASGADRSKSEDRYANARDFLSWANNHKEWIIIYDNLDYSDREQLMGFEEKFLVKNKGNGKIIFTTQNSKPFAGEPIILIEEFSDTEAAQFIKHRYSRIISTDDVRKLKERLSNYPIALDQACSFLSAHPYESCDSYIQLLDQYQTRFFNRFDKPRGHKLSTYETVAVAMDKLNDEGAVALLKLLAYASPDGTDLLTIKAMVDHYSGDAPAGLRGVFVDRLSFYEAVDMLASYSLCGFVRSDDDRYAPFGGISAIRLHRLVQEVIRDIIGEDDSYFRIYTEYYRSVLFGSIKDEPEDVLFKAMDFLRRAAQRFEDSDDRDLLCNIADMLIVIVLGTGFNIKDECVWFFDRLTWFACVGYGADSVQGAFAMTRSFSNYGWSDYKTGIARFLEGLEVEMRNFPQYMDYIYDIHTTPYVHEDEPIAIEKVNLSIGLRIIHLLQDLESAKAVKNIIEKTKEAIKAGISKAPEFEWQLWFDEGGNLSLEDHVDEIISDLRSMPEDAPNRITAEEREKASLWWRSKPAKFIDIM